MEETDIGIVLYSKHLGVGDEAGQLLHELVTGIMLLQHRHPFSQTKNNRPGREHRNLHAGVFALNLFSGTENGFPGGIP